MMKLSGKHKVYALVVALGLGALMVDRLWLAESGAGPRPAAAAMVPLVKVSPAIAADIAARGEALADQLRLLQDTRQFDLNQVPDAFAPGRGWQPARTAVAAASASSSRPGSQFAQSHRLMAVMSDPATGAAYVIINGRCLLPGQEVDGFVLRTVGQRTATLEGHGEQVELKLASPATP